MVDIQAARTALYRLYDAENRLLYVGITNMPNVRWTSHSLKPWWRSVARKDITWFDNRRQAAEAEVRAIRAEQPLHNVVHAPRYATSVDVTPLEIDEACDFDATLVAAAVEWRRAKQARDEADAELRVLLIEGRAAGKGPSRMAKLTGFTREWVAKIAPDPTKSS